MRGDPVPVVESIDPGGDRNTAAFSVSANGVLVYRTAAPTPTRMVWLDRKCTEVGLVPAGENLLDPALSPDGKMAVGSKRDDTGSFSGFWLIDLVRGDSTRFTFEPGIHLSPVWSPDARQILYSRSNAIQQSIPKEYRRAWQAGTID